jgi:hypothetical protein
LSSVFNNLLSRLQLAVGRFCCRLLRSPDGTHVGAGRQAVAEWERQPRRPQGAQRAAAQGADAAGDIRGERDSVTYASGLSTSGMFWDGSQSGRNLGRLAAFFLCNTTAFITSLVILLLDKLCANVGTDVSVCLTTCSASGTTR